MVGLSEELSEKLEDVFDSALCSCLELELLSVPLSVACLSSLSGSPSLGVVARRVIRVLVIVIRHLWLGLLIGLMEFQFNCDQQVFHRVQMGGAAISLCSKVKQRKGRRFFFGR